MPIPYCGLEQFFSPPTMQQKIDVWKRKQPQLWKEIHTRTIVEPHTHPPNSWLSMSLCEGVEEANRSGGCGNIAQFTRLMARHDFPTYYVSKNLFAAIRHTNPPKGQTWDCVPFPFPAVVFMLPKGELKHPRDGHSISFIGVGQFSNNRVYVMYPCCEGSLSDGALVPMSEPLEPSVGWLMEHTEPQYRNQAHSETSSYIFGLAANLLLAMSARAEYVTLGERVATKKPPQKTGKLPQHHPTWLGRHYQTVYEAGTVADPTRRFTELGWRCGHYKIQRYGQGRKDSKVIWIEPYIARTRGLELIA